MNVSSSKYWMIDAVMYGILFILTIVVILFERRDLACPTPESTDTECTLFGGMALDKAIVNDQDSCPTILDKLKKTFTSSYRKIRWRRAFTIAVISSLLLWALLLSPNNIQYSILPHWYTFYICVLIIFTISFGYTNYVDYHFDRIVDMNIENSIGIFKDRCIQ